MILLFVLPLLLFVFWAWMFWEMSNNPQVPPCFLTVTRGNNRHIDWAVAFVVLSVITAGFYFFTVHNRKSR